MYLGMCGVGESMRASPYVEHSLFSCDIYRYIHITSYFQYLTDVTRSVTPCDAVTEFWTGRCLLESDLCFECACPVVSDPKTTGMTRPKMAR